MDNIQSLLREADLRYEEWLDGIERPSTIAGLYPHLKRLIISLQTQNKALQAQVDAFAAHSSTQNKKSNIEDTTA